MERTAGRASWLALAGLAGAAALQPLACRPDGQAGGGPLAQAQADLLAQVGPGVVEPALARFEADAVALEQALSTLTASPQDAAAQDAARAAWTRAFATWQELEVMQIGPAGSSLTALGGQDLRDEIYSWPTVNPCRVDQETVEASWDDSGWFTENLVNVYGLDAIEYLLWAGPENDCPGQVPINAEGDWQALGEAGVAANRAAYGRALAAHLVDQAGDLADRWSPQGGDFSGALTRTDGAPYSSSQEALNAVFDALFYLEIRTKDRKLALPLGLLPCGADDCATTVEALPSGQGAAAIAANLRGFRSLFTGGDGVGMDDLLVELGEDALVDEVLADVDAAITLADALDLPLDEAVETRPEAVAALHAAVKAVADDLKGDVATVLTLQVPAEAAGDND
jgi:uncharacterized protein